MKTEGPVFTILVIVLSALLSVGCSVQHRSSSEKDSDTGTLTERTYPELDYTILSRELEESEYYNRLEIHAAVQGDITAGGVMNITGQLFRENIKLERPRAPEENLGIRVYIYATENDYLQGSRHCLASIGTGGKHSPIDIMSNRKLLTALDPNAEIGRWFHKPTCMDIYAQLCEAEARATMEARSQSQVSDPRRFPSSTWIHRNKLRRAEEALVTDYRQVLADKYEVSLEQLASIESEGLKEDWPRKRGLPPGN